MAVWHPQIVHFVIALGIIGVVLRIVAFSGRLRFAGPAATLLLVMAAGAAVLAARSGDDAHGPAERIPGAGEAVDTHEEWGNRARNLFLLVATLELVALVAARRRKEGAPNNRIASGLRVASGVVGLAAVFAVYEAAEHGGELVYAYAGGVGTRSGDVQDVNRLLTAGLYHQAMVDREAGRGEDAARLLVELGRRAPDDVAVQLLVAESLLQDRKDASAALAAVDGIDVGSQPNLIARVGVLRVDALEQLGRTDSARVLLAELSRQFPENRRVRERVERLGT